MRLSTILTLLLFTVTALSITPRGNSCFGDAKTYCSGHDADPGNATMAITNACAKIGSCTPGVAANRPKETGIVYGWPYTAVLGLGNQCGGIPSWSTEACVALFKKYVDEKCDLQYPAGAANYQLGNIYAPCDDTYLLFNFGG